MRFTLIILGCLVPFYVCATNNIYKCIDATGKKEYQSRPCKIGLVNSTINISTGSSTNLDEVKKQQELKEKEEQAKLEQQKKTTQELLEKQLSINKEAIAESENNQTLIKSNPKKYSADAIHPYAPDNLSDLVKNFPERLAEIERLRRAAAEKALVSNQCGRVESSELDAKSTKEELRFSVNCSLGKVFTFTEKELKN
jgi:hypothetical protein